MRDETNKTIPGLHPADTESPRGLMASVVELLRIEDASIAEIDAVLGSLAKSMDRCFASRRSSGTYEDAIARAPWLTAEFERLNHQETSLRQSLQALRTLVARRDGSFEVARQLTSQFDDFVEFYLEHEAAEHNFLEAAYPGPDWTN